MLANYVIARLLKMSALVSVIKSFGLSRFGSVFMPRRLDASNYDDAIFFFLSVLGSEQSRECLRRLREARLSCGLLYQRSQGEAHACAPRSSSCPFP